MSSKFEEIKLESMKLTVHEGFAVMKRSQFVKRLHFMKVVFVMIRVFKLQQNSSKNDIMTLVFPEVIPQKIQK